MNDDLVNDDEERLAAVDYNRFAEQFDTAHERGIPPDELRAVAHAVASHYHARRRLNVNQALQTVWMGNNHARWSENA